MEARSCCFVGCDEHAEFEIIDIADPRPDAAFTDACEAHVGALLGHSEGWDGRVLGWEVQAINPIHNG